MTTLLRDEFMQQYEENNEVNVSKQTIKELVEKNIKLVIKHKKKQGFKVNEESLALEAEALFDHVYNEHFQMPSHIMGKIEEPPVVELTAPSKEELVALCDLITKEKPLLVNKEKVLYKSLHVQTYHATTGALLAREENLPIVKVDLTKFIRIEDEVPVLHFGEFMEATHLAVRSALRYNLVSNNETQRKLVARDNLILVSIKNLDEAFELLEYDRDQANQLLTITKQHVSQESFKYSYELRVAPPLLETGIVKTTLSGTAVEQLEKYLDLAISYADHNPCITVRYKRDEWEAIAEWLEANWNDYMFVHFKEIEE